jgi:hypothetical protein
MIKPNELRVDNIIGWRTGYGELIIGKVFEVHSDKVAISPAVQNGEEGGQGFMRITGIEPITLSPEWLERCGAVKLKGMPFYEIDMPSNIGQIQINPDNGIIFLRHFRNPSTSINPNSGNAGYYLHALQNLYFALTGEELTIKETI